MPIHGPGCRPSSSAKSVPDMASSFRLKQGTSFSQSSPRRSSSGAAVCKKRASSPRCSGPCGSTLQQPQQSAGSGFAAAHRAKLPDPLQRSRVLHHCGVLRSAARKLRGHSLAQGQHRHDRFAIGAGEGQLLERRADCVRRHLQEHQQHGPAVMLPFQRADSVQRVIPGEPALKRQRQLLFEVRREAARQQ